ncbi:MAG: BrnT family toxin [Bryobacteraceae bacterium]
MDGAFSGKYALKRMYNGRSTIEERWQTVGMVSGVLLFVAHTYRDDASGEAIRLISARKAIAHERRAYAKSQKRSGG